MNISEISSTVVPVLKPSDSASFAIDRMMESRLFDLPVVGEEGAYLGMVAFELLEELAAEEPIEVSQSDWESWALHEQEPVLKLLNLLKEGQFTCAAVLDEEGRFKYAIQIHDLVSWMATQSMLSQPGGIITLQIGTNNYSLSEIARIAESNNASIVNLRISELAEQDFMLVHLKFNLVDLTHVMATFERFGYHIVSFHHQSHLDDFYTERYDALMRFLDI
jgi:CBS domain-containing protein